MVNFQRQLKKQCHWKGKTKKGREREREGEKSGEIGEEWEENNDTEKKKEKKTIHACENCKI